MANQVADVGPDNWTLRAVAALTATVTPLPVAPPLRLRLTAAAADSIRSACLQFLRVVQVGSTGTVPDAVGAAVTVADGNGELAQRIHCLDGHVLRVLAVAAAMATMPAPGGLPGPAGEVPNPGVTGPGDLDNVFATALRAEQLPPTTAELLAATSGNRSIGHLLDTVEWSDETLNWIDSLSPLGGQLRVILAACADVEVPDSATTDPSLAACAALVRVAAAVERLRRSADPWKP